MRPGVTRVGFGFGSVFGYFVSGCKRFVVVVKGFVKGFYGASEAVGLGMDNGEEKKGE